MVRGTLDHPLSALLCHIDHILFVTQTVLLKTAAGQHVDQSGLVVLINFHYFHSDLQGFVLCAAAYINAGLLGAG